MISWPGQVRGALKFMHSQMGNQAQIGAFAHHGGPAVPAGRPQRPGDDRARDLIGADSGALPKEPTFGGRRSGRDVEGNRERSQHQGGRDAAIEAVGITDDLAGEFGQADRRVRVVQDPCQDLDGDRDGGDGFSGRKPGQQAAATAPIRPLRHPVLGRQVVLGEQEVEMRPESLPADASGVALGGPILKWSAR